VWWHTPVTPTLRSLKQEDGEFKANSYPTRHCLEKNRKERKRKQAEGFK
jgi:hypothetical protein